jgi:hypothetical protein
LLVPWRHCELVKLQVPETDFEYTVFIGENVPKYSFAAPIEIYERLIYRAAHIEDKLELKLKLLPNF